MDSRESLSGLICRLLPVILALGVQAEIRIDRDRERNEVLVFAEFVLKCRVVECVWSHFFASQVRCRAKGYSAQAMSMPVQIENLERGSIRVCEDC